MSNKSDDELIVMQLSEKKDESFIPSGEPVLDAIMGGGFYRGRITEISGNAGVGKTHLVSKLMANMSKEHKILYIDSEFSLNKERVRALGADPENISYVADSRLEKVCEFTAASVGKFDVIILDSLASLTPLTIDTQAIGESSNIGLFARLVKQWVMKLRPRLGESNTAFIVINQMRKPIGLYATIELPGGMAFSHVCDVRLRLSTNSSAKIEAKGIRTGHWVTAECTKSKVSQPFVKAKFRIDY